MSAFGDAAAVPPEVNYTVMATGDLGASLVSAAAGYETVADMLMAEMTAMGLNTSTTAMVGWQGPGGVMMQMSAAEFMQTCAAASAWARIGQVQAAEVAAAHTTAVEAMIPAEVALAFEFPLATLLDPAAPRRESREWKGRMREYWVWPHDTHFIWGATATILVALAQALREG